MSPLQGKRVVVSGASGLVGRALVAALETCGAEAVTLVRRASDRGPGRLYWEPSAGPGGDVDREGLEGSAAVVHLAGESIAAGRWSAARKASIEASRVQGTGLLAEALAGLSAPPRILVSASAIGFYGDRGDALLDENSEAGAGFLAGVCQAWEKATAEAEAAGIPVVHLRTGLVLAEDGGALEKMLPPFKLGVGGPLGSGQQWVSWIALEDLVGLVLFLCEGAQEPGAEAASGPVNAVAPEPLRQADFAKALGRALGRPAVLPAPAFALRLGMGEMAHELLLASQRVLPKRAGELGFEFQRGDLDEALREVLGR